MASRRMFSHAVITTDKFQSLSRDSQFLYMHLGMHADDDGFLGSPLMLAKMIGCGKEELAELAENGYIISFPTGVCVITHWHRNNYIQKDRYTETVYRAEKAHLVIEDGVYRYCEDAVVSEAEVLPEDTPAQEEQKEAPKSTPLLLGTYRNVSLTKAELEKLKATFSDWKSMIENLSRKIAMHGYQYKNHYVVLVEWAKQDAAKAEKSRAAPQGACSAFRAQTMDTYLRIAEEIEKRQFAKAAQAEGG